MSLVVALHATKCPLVFKECTDPPYNALKHQDGLGVTREVAFLLENKVKMLFFNGQSVSPSVQSVRGSD